jgi:GntR family transcriptional regulator
MTPKPKWEQLADKLRAQIEDGTYPPGSVLPVMDDLVASGEGARATVHQAYRALEAEGYVVMIRRRGTVVRDRTPVRVPLSRYGKVLKPGGTKGPWETATSEQGLDGRMKTVDVRTEPASEAIASQLGVAAGALVVRRTRHATIGEDVVQVQRAWYPQDIAETAGLDHPGKVNGGAYTALVSAGLLPRKADEMVTARMPGKDEATDLSIGTAVPVLLVERITRGQDGRVLELLHIIGAADRLQLVYDNLPLRKATS